MHGLPEGHAMADDPLWDDSTSAEGDKPHLASRRRLWWPAVGLLVLSLLGVGVTVAARSGGQQTQSYITTPGILQVVGPDQRVMAPQVQGELLDGSYFSTDGWRGHIIVVNFWASWCAPCRKETPELVQVANATRSQGVEFLGIDIRDDRDSATAFAQNYQELYPTLFDPDAQIQLAFRGLPPNAVPTTFVFDRHGRIAARALGRITGAQLEAVLATLNSEP